MTTPNSTQVRVRLTIRCIQRNRVTAPSELGFHRLTIGTNQFLTSENDVGQAWVLVIQGYTQQRRSRSLFARVVGAVVLRTFATDILQGTNGRDLSQVFVIYHFGIGRVNMLLIISLIVIVIVIIIVIVRSRRSFRIHRTVAVVVITATTSGNAYCYQDSEREISQFHTGCTFLNLS